MGYQDDVAKLEQYRAQIKELRKKMRETQAAIEPQPVSDYELSSQRGPVRLSSLFGDRDTLIVIHNMGTGCTSCTLWADGFNGIYDHVLNRAAFVVASPDAPDIQQQFAASRGWKFPMVSYQGNSFGTDMGYLNGKKALPGISVFKKKDGKILRVSNTSFMEGDDFCALWHIFDLFPEGAAGWRPKYRYEGLESDNKPWIGGCCL